MKKTIKILIEKMDILQEKKDGTLQGGFISIKGGFLPVDFSDNPNCSNIKDCNPATNRECPGTNMVCYT